MEEITTHLYVLDGPEGFEGNEFWWDDSREMGNVSAAYARHHEECPCKNSIEEE